MGRDAPPWFSRGVWTESFSTLVNHPAANYEGTRTKNPGLSEDSNIVYTNATLYLELKVVVTHGSCKKLMNEKKQSQVGPALRL